jgi:hypothetical protein
VTTSTFARDLGRLLAEVQVTSTLARRAPR